MNNVVLNSSVYRVRLRIDPEDGWQWYQLIGRHTITAVRFNDEQQFTAWCGTTECQHSNALTAANMVADKLEAL